MSCLDKIKQIPIVAGLSQLGYQMKCLEVGHHDRRYVKVIPGTNIIKCFGGSCKKNAFDLLEYIQDYENLSFGEAVQFACQNFGIDFDWGESNNFQQYYSYTEKVLGEYRQISFSPAPVPGPARDWEYDYLRFMRTLYDRDEYVVVANHFRMGDSGNWIPVEKFLQVHKWKKEINLLPSPNGAWSVINPIKLEYEYDHQYKYNRLKKGDDAVAAFKYVLIESDTMDLESQLGWLLASRLPIKTLVHSGGKSIHAVVYVGAKSLEEYRNLVSRLFVALEAMGFKNDMGNSNPCRYTRVPGVLRGGRPQYLIPLPASFVSSSYEQVPSWLEWVELRAPSNTPQILDPVSLWKKGEAIEEIKGVQVFNLRRWGDLIMLGYHTTCGSNIAAVKLFRKGKRDLIIGEPQCFAPLIVSMNPIDDVAIICPDIQTAIYEFLDREEGNYLIPATSECLSVFPLLSEIYPEAIIIDSPIKGWREYTKDLIKNSEDVNVTVSKSRTK